MPALPRPGLRAGRSAGRKGRSTALSATGSAPRIPAPRSCCGAARQAPAAPISKAGTIAATTSSMCRTNAAAKTSRRLAYSRASDSASNVPVFARTRKPAPMRTMVRSWTGGRASTRCSASISASAAQAKITQHALPSDTVAKAGAPAVRLAAARPATAGIAITNTPAANAAAPRTRRRGRTTESATSTTASSAIAARPPAWARNSTVRPGGLTPAGSPPTRRTRWLASPRFRR